MKFLLDTNAIIPIEPTNSEDVEELTPLIAKLIGLLSESQQDYFLHPASIQEMNDDRDQERRATRQLLLHKYVQLPSPPPVPDSIIEVIGPPPAGVHGENDYLLISAVVGDAVDFLVTEDKGIHKRAARLGVKNRVLSINDAIETIHRLIPQPPLPPPAVHPILCHELDHRDPFFDSLRKDYEGFDEWIKKAKREHRPAFLIKSSDSYAGIAILKNEAIIEQGASGNRLKICTFKINEYSRGFRFGELLLKSIFQYADSQNCQQMYCTCFPRQEALINLFQDFGFENTGMKQDEIVFTKRLNPTQNEYDNSDPHEFHVRFGPPRVKVQDASVYVVPIKPGYHKCLFPELEAQMDLFPGETVFGNSLCKAYLCNAQTREMVPGSLLLFYRSDDWRTIRAVGVADEILRSAEPSVIARFVGKRTVYSLSQIESMCRRADTSGCKNRGVLAMLFRQANILPPIGIQDLISHGALKSAPQSITKVKSKKALEWIQKLVEK